ncbi:beta-phosphoglucomutase [Sulfolobus acidocaldarius DSM 639]|uniref:Beta-phosphoglucomutase n=1 Tax=Sulfolobus acidocaldarius (strain ATCC 33909 / DSM 639 / JCM 8929 / NBRC 15157 / NCIMB 11770) TaxID=330779 RepID=Q4JCF8_SULAC|nr:beta-phosphoglucomutase [Sulfolobus acidocaldarius DSM 639]
MIKYNFPVFKVKGVIFDLDGTLANTALIHKEAWEKALDRLGIKSDVKIDNLLGRKSSDIAKLLAPNNWSELINIKNQIYVELVKEKASPTPCALDLLSYLRKKEIKTAIVTSSNKLSSGSVLKKLGITSEVVLTGDDVINSKPNPEGINKALSLLYLDGRDVIGVGDTEVDVEAYYKAGLGGIYLVKSGVPFREEVVKMYGGIVISSLCELLELIS